MFFVALLFTFINAFAQTGVPPAAGAGTSESPYQIANLENLYWISLSPANWNNHFIQTADIDASPTHTWFPDGLGGFLGWAPIGTESNPFAGYYNGQDYSIDALYIHRLNENHVGLFGKGYWGTSLPDNTATLKNICLTNADVSGGDRTGAIVGYLLGQANNHRPVLLDSFSSGSVFGANEVGGLAGSNVKAQIFDDYSSCNVTGTTRVGGLSGYTAAYAAVERSYFRGNVSGSEQVGGISGYCYNYAPLINTYNLGNVSGSNIVGGLTGGMAYNSALRSSYSTGQVSSDSNGGGIIGSSYDSTCGVMGCFWDTQTSGIYVSAGGTGKTTAQMKDIAMYSTAQWAPYDFVNYWFMIPGETRPILRTEYSGNIRNSHQLQLIRMNLAGEYQLMANLDLSSIQDPRDIWGTSVDETGGFVPLGTLADPFTGTLDGNAFQLSGLYINRSLVDYQSLLGVCNGVQISNLMLNAGEITGQTYTGSLASLLTNLSVVTNCGFQGDLTGTWQFTGGFIGNIDNSSISGCYSEGTVTASSWSGGLIGRASGGASISNCYSLCSTMGNGRVGGLIGGSYNSETINSYSAGRVNGFSVVGGLIGEQTGSVVDNCFWDVETSWQGYSAGGVGVQGLSTIEMTTQSTFTAAGWDFVGESINGIEEIWDMDSANNAGYPFLNWLPIEELILGIPQNVTMSSSDLEIMISWDAVDNALSYRVFSCPLPDGVFEEDLTGVFTGTSWTCPASNVQRFYHITAVAD